jgi:hypothetical protein
MIAIWPSASCYAIIASSSASRRGLSLRHVHSTIDLSHERSDAPILGGALLTSSSACARGAALEQDDHNFFSPLALKLAPRVKPASTL